MAEQAIHDRRPKEERGPGERVLTYLGGGRLSFSFSRSDFQEERRRKEGSLYVFLLPQDAIDGEGNLSLFSRSVLKEERRSREEEGVPCVFLVFK